MIIVCTKDADIRDWTQDPQSQSDTWNGVWGIPRATVKAGTSAVLRDAIAGVPPGDPLCLNAHGNNDEIGDEGNGPADWGWRYQDLAQILAAVPPRTGPLLIRACASKVVNFSAQLAVALGQLGGQPDLWCYGYRIPLSVRSKYPPPRTLDTNRDLQGTLAR